MGKPLYTATNIPPTAVANYQEMLMCAGDSIAFSDASINAAPGWTWYFPGGSPSTSNLANPTIYYPPGSYTASLVVSNSNGSDSVSISVQVQIATNEITLDLTTDNYPSETSWNITDTLGNLMYEFGSNSTQSQWHSSSICLNDDKT